MKEWTKAKFEDMLKYLQPTNYIVKSTKYSDDYDTPVLTAGKSFIKGYTNEIEGIFDNLPTIIFDDFTTASQWVNFRFKVKSSAMKILVPTSLLVNMRFMYYCMQVHKIRSDTHKRYWISVYAPKEFPLPPLPEQRAMVSKIEELFSSLDNGIANLEKAQKQLKVYRQAVLKKAFEGELTKEWREKQTDLPSAEELLEQIKTERENYYDQQLVDWKVKVDEWEENGKEGKKPGKPSHYELSNKLINQCSIPKKWTELKSEDIFSYVTSGSRGWAKHYSESGSMFIRITNLNFDTLALDLREEKMKYVSLPSGAEGKRTKIKEGDFLFSITGYLGMFAIAPKLKEAYVNQHISLARPYPFINSSFVGYWIIAKSGGIHFLNMKRKGATKAGLGLDDIKGFPIPYCSQEEQQQIVQEIESRLSVCDKVEESIVVGLKKSEALKQSILKKAFEGALLSEVELEACRKEKDWEPAEVLLERIKNEKKK